MGGSLDCDWASVKEAAVEDIAEVTASAEDIAEVTASVEDIAEVTAFAEDTAEVTASAVVETMLVVEMLLRDLMQNFPFTVVVKTEGVAMQCTESKDGLTRPKTEKRWRGGRGTGAY